MSQALGRRVHDLRSAAGLTQEEVAARVGVSRATIQNIEKGRTAPRPVTIRRLAELFDVDPAQLKRLETSAQDELGQPPTAPGIDLEELEQVRLGLEAALDRVSVILRRASEPAELDQVADVRSALEAGRRAGRAATPQLRAAEREVWLAGEALKDLDREVKAGNLVDGPGTEELREELREELAAAEEHRDAVAAEAADQAG